MSNEEREPEQTAHCGIMLVTDLPRLFPEITIEATDTQCHLRDIGTFEVLRKLLLLPETYTICAIYKKPNNREWFVLIESPDLPDVRDFAWNDIEYPRIEPTYCQTFNAETGQSEPHLVSLTVHAQRIVRITDGDRWILRATMEQVSKVTGIAFRERVSDGHKNTDDLNTVPVDR
jgi:hypothetical protein